MININRHLRVEGFFNMATATSEDGPRTTKADFRNMILDSGLNMFMERGRFDWCTYACRVGTGNSPPAATQTRLDSQVAGSDTTFAGLAIKFVQHATDPYFEMQNFIRFPIGAAAGNLSEIGMGEYTQPSRDLWSRALILDASGNPTTITIRADELLEVVYTLRVYVDVTEETGNLTIDGNPYSYRLLTQLAGSNDHTNSWMTADWFGVRLGSGQSVWYNTINSFGTHQVGIDANIVSNNTDTTVTAFVAGTYKRTKSWQSGVGTIPTGVLAGAFLAWGLNDSAMQARQKIQFTPAIPYHQSQRITVSISISIARYTPP